DIDSFHIINDTCGYTNGNHLLKEIAAVLLSNLTDTYTASPYEQRDEVLYIRRKSCS
ncbi:MAG: diguanylate cyclase, partial [Clostridia bacterium]|nr:diguanylate cyclase [Clostridia bacterium]